MPETPGCSFWLGIVVCLIFFKLAGVVAWPWWFILAPIWLPGVLFGVFCAVAWLVMKIKLHRSHHS